jgi:ActR/RegA family two-component response regulator
MQNKGDILILEDIDEMAVPYRIELSAQGYNPIHVDSLAQLKETIVRKSFLAAYIDIMLDERDDENRDGLKALDIIKKSGDETLCIVVTGHGDVPITRDALVKYGAHDVIEKQRTRPEDFVALIEKGLGEKPHVTINKHDLMRCLSGNEFFFSWEEHLISALHPKAGFDSVYTVVPKVFSDLLPILSMPEDSVLVPLVDRGFAFSHIWSRKLGKSVIVMFGDESRLDKMTMEGELTVGEQRMAFGRVLSKVRDANLVGLVFEDINQEFSGELVPAICRRVS